MNNMPGPKSDQPLRIAHTESSCGWGGQEIRILEEIRGMANRGHHVSLACPEIATIHRRALDSGIQVVGLPIARKGMAAWRAVRDWLSTNRFDVVNTHSSTDSWLTALACASLRKSPAIVRTRHISAPIPRNLASGWLYRTAASHVVTTGESLRRTLIEINGLEPSRVTSVPTGIDTQRFSPADRREARIRLGLREDVRWIGIVATLRSWKGHLVLLDAVTRLRAANVHLAIVGDGPMKDAIAGRIVESGLADRVLLAGEQREPEHWLRALDVFCLPSYANEGVPQALMQAMLTGLPVVSTPVGAITEAVTDGITGLIVPPRDPASLAAAIDRLLADAVLASRLGNAARKDAAERFGYERMILQMEAIFAEAAARRVF